MPVNVPFFRSYALKQGQCQGEISYYSFISKALFLWSFFPSEAFSPYHCRRLGIHPSSQIPSTAAFDASAQDLREPSLELLGGLDIISM